MSEVHDLARLITGGLGNGVSTADFREARSGSLMLGLYIADAILDAGYRKQDS